MINTEAMVRDLRIITGNEGGYKVSEDITRDFEAAVLRDPDVTTAAHANYYLSRICFRIWKYFPDILFIRKGLLRVSGFVLPRQNLFTILMGPKFAKCLPLFAGKGFKAIYLFDAWPGYYPFILKFVKDFSVNMIFLSSRESAVRFKQLTSIGQAHWIAEGIDPSVYRHDPVQEKKIDVLFSGRKYSAYHEKIYPELPAKGYVYLFSPDDGSLLFPDRESFIHGLAGAKISVCFPANVTHPERTGGIETMTSRYLQSMASKCLILGKAPDEMVELFGYNPVIEADMTDPAGQIIDILEHYSDYQELIERNYSETLRLHTWEKRWESIKSIISAERLIEN